MSNIPTDDLKEFAEVAQFIGEQAAGAELEAAALERYSEELTDVAHAAGLLPDNQKIVFNADGALNVLEMVSGELTELDGQTAEVIATADAESALIKLNDAEYKVLEYDDTTGIATLSADGKNAYGEINLATGEVRKFDEEEAEAYLNANTDDFETNVTNAKSLLAEIKDKTVTITSVFKSVYQNVKSALGFASGTDNAPPGAHWVGEEGPELMWFNGGEKVLDAQRSAALMREYSHSPAFPGAMSAIRGAEPISAIQYVGTSGRAIEIKNNFTIEGNATEETIAALEKWGEKFREIVRDELGEISENSRRTTYI